MTNDAAGASAETDATSTSATPTTAGARVALAYERIREVDRPEVWIHLVPEQTALIAAAAVDEAVATGAHLPLAGWVFAAKDNIDVAGMPTTAGCPAYAFEPAVSAPSVQRLTDGGAIFIGKTNLDQFATGLVGTRSPHGAVRNAIDPTWISGGSSSGSAVAVALGIVTASLGTDTAGSGRVPAACNGIVGLKPTRGLVSARGVVPACRSLDCVSVFAESVEAAWTVLEAMSGYDPDDAWSRPEPGGHDGRFRSRTIRLGVASSVGLGLSPSFAVAYDNWKAGLVGIPGLEVVPFDPSDLLSVGELLYEGAFVAERAAAVGQFVAEHAGEVDPVVGKIITDAGELRAAQLASDLDSLAVRRRRAERSIDGIDAVGLPTMPTIYRIAEVQADPFATNSSLGGLNNFCNLLDFCAATIPAGKTSLGEPFGLNLYAPAGHDRSIARLAAVLRGENLVETSQLFATPPKTHNVQLAVVGAHLSGQPLNGQLTERGAVLVQSTTTSAKYRLSALDTKPPKPGLWRVSDGTGCRIEVEVWELDVTGFGSFTAMIPGPLGIGTVELADGREVRGFICEAYAIADAPDISSFGGWRAYLASKL